MPRCREEKPQLGKAAGREVRCFVAQESWR
jgi:hypothetical protein